MTQSEIAQRLSLSTAKVNRLLLKGREQGYVNITIRTPFQQLFDLEARLEAVFGIQDAIVIPSLPEGSSSPLNDIGAVAADYLLAHLRDGDILAITPGTTVQAVAQALEVHASLSGRGCANPWSGPRPDRIRYELSGYEYG